MLGHEAARRARRARVRLGVHTLGAEVAGLALVVVVVRVGVHAFLLADAEAAEERDFPNVINVSWGSGTGTGTAQRRWGTGVRAPPPRGAVRATSRLDVTAFPAGAGG